MEPERDDTQIAGAVRGFMDIWRHFESMIPGEIARTEALLFGISPQTSLPRDREYELFFRVSNALVQYPSLTMGEVAKALSVPLSKATRTADWLIARGFVERLPDTADRRIVRVRLTAQGRALHHFIEGNIHRRLQEILSCLSLEEKQTLFQLIGKVVGFVNQEGQIDVTKR